MKIITNVSTVTDYSAEPPAVTHSNTVTTIIRQTPPPAKITRIFYRLNCNCCCNMHFNDCCISDGGFCDNGFCNSEFCDGDFFNSESCHCGFCDGCGNG